MSRGRLPIMTAMAATVAVSLASSGCIYQSKVEGRELGLPKTFVSGAKAKKKSTTPGRWWRHFGDAELDRLMKLAFAQNLDLEAARARVEQARAQLTAAQAGWWPSIVGKGEVGRGKQIMSEQFQIERNTLTLSLAASYELDIWGRTYFAHKSAKHGLIARQQQLRAAYITLAASIAESYHLAVAARAQLALLRNTIENRTKQLDIVKRRYAEGVVTAVDVYQALGALSQSKAQLPSFEQQLKIAEHGLALLVGRYPGQVSAGALDKLPQTVRELPTGSPRGLLLQRPDLQASYQLLLSTDAQVGVALAARFPSLSFTASIGQSFDPSGLFWNLLGSLTGPLFQGGRMSAEHKRSEAVLKEQLALFRSTLLRAVKEVEDALVTGRAQQARVEHLKERAEVADRALRLALDQYAQGLTTYLNVLNTEQTVYAARSELIAARQALVSARVQLARAVGGSWMDTEIKRERRSHEKRRR